MSPGVPQTWNQALSSNAKIKLDGAHLLQLFAFADGPAAASSCST